MSVRQVLIENGDGLPGTAGDVIAFGFADLTLDPRYNGGVEHIVITTGLPDDVKVRGKLEPPLLMTRWDGAAFIEVTQPEPELFGIQLAQSQGFLKTKVENVSGSLISKGTLFYISGSSTAGKFQIDVADNTSLSTMPARGITLEDIANNDTGDVDGSGFFDGIDTSTLTLNDDLYVGTSGAFTATKPVEKVIQRVASVTNVNATVGSVVFNALGEATLGYSERKGPGSLTHSEDTFQTVLTYTVPAGLIDLSSVTNATYLITATWKQRRTDNSMWIKVEVQFDSVTQGTAVKSPAVVSTNSGSFNPQAEVFTSLMSPQVAHLNLPLTKAAVVLRPKFSPSIISAAAALNMLWNFSSPTLAPKDLNTLGSSSVAADTSSLTALIVNSSVKLGVDPL